jgi:DNA mismatch endonuclease (patch repair protein)
MADIVDPSTRSRMMASIGAKDTLPEKKVRRYLHALGLRYRLHGRSLPGRPDLVLPSFRTVIFVHGCFWHRHAGCRFATTPASNAEFWRRKFQTNIDRDAAKEASLSTAGWRVLTIWECETDNEESLERLFWEVVIRFWTDEIAEERGKVIPKHAWSAGVVRIERNESHGIKPSKPLPFHSLLDMGAVIEKVLLEHAIVLHSSRKMAKYTAPR